MATAWSDPSLNTDTADTTDLLAILRVASSGDVLSYSPLNITLTALFSSFLPTALAAVMAAIPTEDGTTSPIWLNNGVITRTTTGGSQSGVSLSVAAQFASYARWVASLPTSDPGTGTGTFWSNNGIVTESEAS
ncbi:hypothetical protein AA23498_1347 [Acetobacter nitrogenifigens DSM 23921 = NBRC 105050]|uniref:Uncharacterized protein n=1 Tax=Acetobacter nitrogenifigens DSM 23921 = NBRC 105050 TaxID=1120919 RepID=A0A511X5C7_9PROT|nr:hypothetical protein [Acetobacter nitrogenifigens]GBQ92041.1 hypothetical protein AA23498_1347 [Acetobacter nitrogenifigens DSM 23921 = NBRC 105050]GEN58146.1 hypothetical protein ANI02nite_00300 [Acetobacter nitrogenifigens DSM 23921 = NBRC 105050]